MMEIKNAIRMIAPYATQPSPLLWDILLQIVRYVKGAKDNSVKYYDTQGDNSITAYSDASNAMEPKGYSALGTTVMMFGGPIITASRTNNDVHIHSFASELEAIEQTMEETIQFQELIEDLHPQQIPINLYNDNKAAVTFGNREGTKPFKVHHIRTKFLKIQDLVRKKKFTLIHMSNSKLFTDIYTKVLGPKKFIKFRESLKRNNFPKSLLIKSKK